MTVDELKEILANSISKIVNITTTVEVGDFDHLDLDGHEVQSTADPMFRINGSHWSIRNGKIRATAGIVIDIIKSTLGHVSGVSLKVGQRDKEVVRCIGGNSCNDTLFECCELAHVRNMEVPIVNISLNGPFYNSNSWNQIRFQTTGSPAASCVIMECLTADNWLYNNSFTNINGEQPNSGLIHCKSCYGTNMENIGVYDTHLSDNIIDDILWFGKSAAPGLNCKRTTLRNYVRVSGILDQDKYDINIYGHFSDGMLLEQISGVGSRLRVKCPLSATRIEVQEFNDPWRNA